MFMMIGDITIFDIVHICSEFLLVAIVCYFIFFKSYFQEKGKNVATKEDISEITEKIENVKSDIGILTHKKIFLSTEKQNCLLDFYEKFSSWINNVVSASLISNSDSYSLYYLQVIEKLQVLYQNYLSAESKVDIFFNADKELLDAKRSLAVPMLEIVNLLTISLQKMKNEINIENIIRNRPDIIPDNSNKIIDLQENHDKQMNILNDYISERLKKYKFIMSINFGLIKIINDRIMNLE